MDIADIATLAANTLVAAAVTDAWETARLGFALLFGQGRVDPATRIRLDATHDRLMSMPTARLGLVQEELAREWEVRLRDLLADSPDLEARLRELVMKIQGTLRGDVLAAGHSMSAERDVHIRADRGSIAAGVIHGNISGHRQAGLPASGSQGSLTGSGMADAAGQPWVHADRGSVGVGQLFYQTPAAPGLVVSLPPRPAMLAGRNELLTELRDRLCGDDRPRPQVAVLSGLGGAGKTSVAVEYAHQRLPAAQIAWQLPAERSSVLAAEFGRLAAQLGVGGGLLDPRDPVASVHGALAAWQQRWLLVFDNAPDHESVRTFLPPAGDGEILITSQSPYWPPGQAVEVRTLNTDDAAGFLITRTGDPDRQSAMDLAVELGGLPLALEQAAAYVLATGDTLAAYLSLLSNYRARLLATGRVAGYGKTIGTTWEPAFADLESNSPQAVALLRLFAYCAQEPIPADLLLRPPQGTARQLPPALADALTPLLEDPPALGMAKAELRRYSLVSFSGSGPVTVHPLIQAETRERIPVSEAPSWHQAAAVLIEAALPADPLIPAIWPVFAALLPHAETALGYDSQGMERLADYLGNSGNYAPARDLWNKIVSACELSFGAADSRTLIARINHANMSGEAGNPQVARDSLINLVPAITRALGPDHPDTLTARSHLARYTGRSGDAATARDMFIALVPVYERVFGPEHPSTLNARTNMAGWTGWAGDPAAARDQYATLVQLRKRIMGAEHLRTLSARRYLEKWTGMAGDPATARDQAERLLPVTERILGPEHPITLTIRRHLAYWTGQTGNLDAAREQFDALLPVIERVLGPSHPYTTATRQHLLGPD